MTDVFLSYKREDEALASELVSRIRTTGIGVWWDRDIPPGAPWEKTIEDQLSSAEIVIVIWTKFSIESENVRAEARRGKSIDRLIQIIADDCEPPLFFSEQQTLRLYDRGKIDDDRLSSLFVRLDELLDSVRARKLKEAGSRQNFLDLGEVERRRIEAVHPRSCLRLVPVGDFGERPTRLVHLRDITMLGRPERSHVFLFDYDECVGLELKTILASGFAGDVLDIEGGIRRIDWLQDHPDWACIKFATPERYVTRYGLTPTSWEAVFDVLCTEDQDFDRKRSQASYQMSSRRDWKKLNASDNAFWENEILETLNRLGVKDRQAREYLKQKMGIRESFNYGMNVGGPSLGTKGRAPRVFLAKNLHISDIDAQVFEMQAQELMI